MDRTMIAWRSMGTDVRVSGYLRALGASIAALLTFESIELYSRPYATTVVTMQIDCT